MSSPELLKKIRTLEDRLVNLESKQSGFQSVMSKVVSLNDQVVHLEQKMSGLEPPIDGTVNNKQYIHNNVRLLNKTVARAKPLVS